ncbi:MAG TPA: aldehyde dehydrogenase family protein [Pseudonocardiaceae bacterium]|jgi:aldehyde dehydrogenase (NAD+)|nr:aldehyde dehydrogenase family protein [Pseudonocardiaceae bacterium]
MTYADTIARLCEQGLIISDSRLSDVSGGSFPHRYPGTGLVQAEVPMAGQKEVDAAVAAAREALPAWRGTAPGERGRLLGKLADLLAEHAEEFGDILTRESGRAIRDTVLDGHFASAWTRYYAGYADKLDGSVVSSAPFSGLDYVLPEPYGVVAAIIPWNIALLSMAMKTAPALAAGNTVVAKPPELTPFAALRFGELALEAGIPPGVLNVIPGDGATGDALVRHQGIDKISFTGGEATARAVMRAAAETLKPMTLELGGKAASIVFPDADLDVAVNFAIHMSTVYWTGQGCVLPTRLFVHDDIYDAVSARLVEIAQSYRVGDPLDPETAVGPVIDERSRDRIIGVIDAAKSAGMGKLLTGGNRVEGDLAGGYFIAPTVFGDVDNSSSLAQNEIFGPVLSILRFRDEVEVVAKANDTRYGLAAYVFTSDMSRGHRMARDLEAGYVCVNGFSFAPTAPFGGGKQSGFGREGGKWGIEEFVQQKNVFVAF